MSRAKDAFEDDLLGFPDQRHGHGQGEQDQHAHGRRVVYVRANKSTSRVNHGDTASGPEPTADVQPSGDSPAHHVGIEPVLTQTILVAKPWDDGVRDRSARTKDDGNS